MADWLNKILIKAKETFNLEDQDVKKIEESVGNVDMTGVKNTADTKVLQKNNGNVPLTGNWGAAPQEGEVEGFTLFKSAQPQTQQPLQTNFVELTQDQQNIENRVMQQAQQLSQQNAISAQIKNEETAQADKDKKLPPFVESIAYADGMATVKKKDGTSFKRPAVKGEPTYKKDGESMEERLTRFFGKEKFENAKTPEAKAELLRAYFEDYYSNMSKSQSEKEKLQFGDFMKLMKNTGVESDYGKIMGRSLHSLYKNNKIEAFEGGLKLTNTKVSAEAFTNGMVSDIGLSGDDAGVQKDLLQKAGNASSHYGFKQSFVQTVAGNFCSINPNNAQFAADQAYSLDASTANKGFKEVIDNSESTEATIKGNTKVNSAVKQKYGDDFEIVSVSDDTINACSKDICHMIDAGEIEGASALFDKNKKYLKDEHKTSIANAASDFAAGKTGSVEDRQDAAALNVNATVKIENAKTQLETSTATTKKMAGADKEVKETYLTENAEKLSEYKDENQLKVDEQLREIDTEEQVYNVTAAQYGHLLAVDNQKEFVQRTTDSGNEEAINNVAENAYEYDVTNRDDVLKMLQDTGYDSTMKALDEAKQKYEAETVEKSKKEEASKQTETSKPAENTSTQTTSSKTTATTAQASQVKIDSIVSDKSTNTTQKAKQIKELGTREQQQAIDKLMEHASLPEIKGYILSGLKTEVIGYLLNNFTVDSKAALESVKYLMTASEVERYEELVKEKKDDKQMNFFIK